MTEPAVDRLGVLRFSALAYAHKPDLAEFLNDWTAGFADRVPEVLRSATFFPEPDAASYVEKRLAAGTQVFKIHVQVGGFDVNDPLLDEPWGLVADAGTPVVLHAGSGPVRGTHTGPDPVSALLRRHPRLTLVIAHLGAPEYADFPNIPTPTPTRSRHSNGSSSVTTGCVPCSGRTGLPQHREPPGGITERGSPVQRLD